MKQRYNLTYRLRKSGVLVDTSTHSIRLKGQEDFDRLPKTQRARVRLLCQKYQYEVQFYIPTPDELDAQNAAKPLPCNR